MEAASFWRGYWHATSNRISQSSIVGTKHGGFSPESSFVMNPRKMLTIAQKENHCIIEVRGAEARVICIARRKRNAKNVHKRSRAPEASTVDCLFIGRSRRGKPYALWLVHLSINARDEHATKWKPCSPNSNNKSGCAECDYDGGGTSLSSSTSRQRLKI